METEEDVELQEVGEERSKRSNGRFGRFAGEDRVEAFLRKRRGGTETTETTVVSACCFCGQRLSEDPVPLSASRELSAEHREKKHPEINPRDIQGMREELQGRKKVAKKRQDREREKARLASQQAKPRTSGPRRASGPQHKPGPPSRQPELTEEMVEKMRTLYGEVRSIALVAERCYAEFGFSSPERLRVTLSKARQERGVTLGIPRNQRRLTEEMIEEAKRLYKEEGMSIREISECCHISWEYSLKGLQNVLRGIFKDHGIDLREEPRRMPGKPSKMTPRRTEVAWQLYSVGNFSLREIAEIGYEFWGTSKNSIGEALKKAGHKLRANKWQNDGSRPISREEALELIKSVS